MTKLDDQWALYQDTRSALQQAIHATVLAKLAVVDAARALELARAEAHRLEAEVQLAKKRLRAVAEKMPPLLHSEIAGYGRPDTEAPLALPAQPAVLQHAVSVADASARDRDDDTGPGCYPPEPPQTAPTVEG
jgi:hypothetical protein